jgi:hypothetical protein
VTGLKDLIVVLLFDIHALIYSLFLYILLLENVRISWVESHTTIWILHLLLGEHLLGQWAEHVGHVFTLRDLNYLQLLLLKV